VSFGGEPKYLLHHCHLRLVDNQVVTRLVVPKAIWRLHRRYDLSLTRLLQLSSSSPLGYLGSLVLGELVEDTVGQFPLRALIPTVIKGSNFGAVLLELPPQEVVISWLAGEAVPILS
jgi:hypothetical protein